MNILITSDIHIGLKREYGHYEGFRLNQYIQLARRLVRIGKERDSDTLFILGDILDVPTNNPPKVIHTLFGFFYILKEQFKHIYYILGQHDIDSKSENYYLNDSIVTLLDKKYNAIYANKMLHSFMGFDVYFSDFDFSGNKIVPEKCDVFCSHVTLDSSFGQEVDNTKFTLGIFGDIHKPVQIENMYSVCTPMQHDLRCHREGMVGLLTLNIGEKPSFERISIIDEQFNPMVLAYEDEEVDEKFTDIVRIPRPLNTMVQQCLKVDRTFSVDSIIEEVIPEELKPKWNEIKKGVDLDRPDLNFKITYLRGKGFWSIEEQEFDFSRDKLVYLRGPNGSGKSTIGLLALALLRPKANLKYQMDKESKDCEVEGIIEYQGKRHRIFKSLKTVKYWIDDEEISCNTTPQLEGKIASNLPFRKWMEIMYLTNGSNFFRPEVRSDIISYAFNLDGMRKYHSNISEKIKEYKSSLKQLNNGKIKNEALIGEYKSRLETLSSSIDSMGDITDKSSDYKRAIEVNSKISTLKEQIRSYTESLNEAKGKKEELVKPDSDLITELDSIISNKTEEKKELDSDINTLKGREKELVNTLNNPPNLCTSCPTYEDIKTNAEKALADCRVEIEDKTKIRTGLMESLSKDINQRDELQKQLNSYQTFFDKYSNIIATLIPKLEDAETELKSLNKVSQEELNELSKSIADFQRRSHLIRDRDECVFQIDSISAELSNLEVDIDLQSKELTDWSTLANLINIDNKEGLITDILIKLCQNISTDMVRLEFEGSIRVYLKVQDRWIDYDRTSGGQRVVTDLILIQRFIELIGNMGLIVFDEYLAPCDQYVLPKCIEVLNTLGGNLLFFITQVDVHNLDCRVIDVELRNNYSRYL